MPQDRRRQVVVEIVSFKDVYDYIYDRRCLDASRKIGSPSKSTFQAWIEEVLKRFEEEIKTILRT